MRDAQRLVNAETVHMDSDAKPDRALVRFRDLPAFGPSLANP
jgi:hypothetical protein